MLSRRVMQGIAAGYAVLAFLLFAGVGIWAVATQSWGLDPTEPEVTLLRVLYWGVQVTLLLLAAVTYAVSYAFPRLERDAMGRFK